MFRMKDTILRMLFKFKIWRVVYKVSQTVGFMLTIMLVSECFSELL